MKFCVRYLKNHWRIGVAGIGACLLFVVSFALFQLPVAAVLYPAALSAIWLGLFALTDFVKTLRQHRRLASVKAMTDVMVELLPEARSLEGAEYRQVIERLCEEQKAAQQNMEKKYDDMVEYYTIWVHQIKTPIASMRLHLQNEDSALSRQLSSDLFRIEQYVEMVLMFLRLDSESSDYVIREQDLDRVVRSAVKKYAAEFISRKIHLVYEPVTAQVITDEKWLSFVVEQVLSNALKYTRSGGTITVTLEEPKMLTIRDTGMGIAPEDLPRIFEKGYTGYRGREDRRASGIGLYLCRRICRNLGHSISAESVPDVGTTIRIDLSQRRLERE